MGIYLPSTGTLDSVVWPGAGNCLHPRYSSWFLFTTCEYGTTCAHSATTGDSPCTLHLLASLPHLCVSPSPTCLDECGFLKSLIVDFHTFQISDSFGWCLFWDLVIILFAVAWGGEACLPMPLSWPQVCTFFILSVAKVLWVFTILDRGGMDVLSMI